MKVLVAVDKNPETFIGLRYACHLLEGQSAFVDALHVRPELEQVAAESYAPFFTKGGMEEAIQDEIREVEKMFRLESGSCAQTNTGCAFSVAAGEPADEILNVAHSERYDMIVLGSQEQSYVRGLLLGTVHAKILHYAKQPVLIVRQFREINNVLAVYRGSETDKAALRFIAPLLAGRKARITLLHVQETREGESDEYARQTLQSGAQILREYDYEPITRMARGDFVEEILKDVAVHRYDLVILGAYSLHRPKYLTLISDEALNLARLTTRPILVFRESTEV